MDVPQREYASQAGVQRLFSPESVAVVGASEAGLGSMVFENLHRDFPGRLYPVHPKRPEVHGVKAYPTVDDLPEPVDMAVILTPAVTVPDIIEHAANRGIGGAVVLAAGFAEAGQAGKDAQQRMTDVARSHAFPIVGPNCNGFYNGAKQVAATFAIPVDMDRPKPGPVAVVSQSGGFGSYILLKAITAGLHASWYLSTGNESDMTVARSLRYMIEQPEVGVILTFFEAVRSPDVFVEVAARAAELGKPVLAVKAGYTAEGSRAALSHTASIAGSGEVYDAICQQYGLIQCSSVEQMIDFGLTLQTGRRMGGNRLGVLTQSGGSGALMADVAETVGLTVPVLPDPDREYLQSLLPSFGSAANPVDTTGAFNMENFDAVYGGLAASDGVDAVLPLIWYVGERETTATRKVWAASDKPLVIATTLSAPDIAEAGIPVYTDPARAVRAIGAVAAFSDFVRRYERVEQPHQDPDRITRARALLDREKGQPFVLESVAKQVLAEYGIPVSREIVADSADAAVKAARTLNGKVALKVLSHGLPHKSDSGALRLGLEGDEKITAAYEEMLASLHNANPGLEIDGVLVQEMVPASVEISCGLQRDPVFGPMIVVGIGGVLIEIVGGAVMLRPPFTQRMAEHAVARIAAGRLRTATRGLTEKQATTIAEAMTALGTLALELPEVESIDINPIRVDGDVAKAVDALIVVAP
ncbi:MAG TPA: acetate--CoA ligase family protein [Streptosporangiaceae bacterium]|nr:acetate--CoA ligase family protein [Streptosporangiaceae bacterium]